MSFSRIHKDQDNNILPIVPKIHTPLTSKLYPPYLNIFKALIYLLRQGSNVKSSTKISP